MLTDGSVCEEEAETRGQGGAEQTILDLVLLNLVLNRNLKANRSMNAQRW